MYITIWYCGPISLSFEHFRSNLYILCPPFSSLLVTFPSHWSSLGMPPFPRYLLHVHFLYFRAHLPEEWCHISVQSSRKKRSCRITFLSDTNDIQRLENVRCKKRVYFLGWWIYFFICSTIYKKLQQYRHDLITTHKPEHRLNNTDNNSETTT